jgi:hypothetical protein
MRTPHATGHSERASRLLTYEMIRPRLVLLLAIAGFAWGAAVTVALAEHYHVNCVGHGFVHGDSTTDGSFFARVEAGCGTASRSCDLYTGGSFIAGDTVTGSATCNVWSRTFGNFTECASTAHVAYTGVFSSHVHKAHNWCG